MPDGPASIVGMMQVRHCTALLCVFLSCAGLAEKGGWLVGIYGSSTLQWFQRPDSLNVLLERRPRWLLRGIAATGAKTF